MNIKGLLKLILLTAISYVILRILLLVSFVLRFILGSAATGSSSLSSSLYWLGQASTFIAVIIAAFFTALIGSAFGFQNKKLILIIFSALWLALTFLTQLL